MSTSRGRHPVSIALSVGLALVLGACTTGAPSGGASTSSAPSPAATSASTGSPSASPSPTPSVRNDAANRLGWKISTAGLGPMRLGLSGDEGIALGVAVQRKPDETGQCPVKDFPYEQSELFLLPKGDPNRAVISMWRSRLHTIIVNTRDFPTISGLRVGDSAAKVMRVLGTQARRTKDGGDGTAAIVVRDSRKRYVEFLVGTGKVTGIAVGTGTPANSSIDFC